jgi:hypothetical protein
MSFEITGQLFEKFETQKVSDRFQKREFVLLVEENNAGRIFTDHIKFQLIQDKCDLIDPFNTNDEIKVSFNLKGNKWEKNGQISYFTNLDAWRVESGTAQSSGGSDSSSETPFPMEEPVSNAPDATPDTDDLPF